MRAVGENTGEPEDRTDFPLTLHGILSKLFILSKPQFLSAFSLLYREVMQFFFLINLFIFGCIGSLLPCVGFL